MTVALPKVLLSITSIPRRFDNSLREVVSSLRGVEDQVVVCLPSHYRKWGPTPAPDYLCSSGNVALFQPSQDYGPATKLLGAIEYIHSTARKFDAIVTLDDDLYYADVPAVIDYLKRQSLAKPGCAITIGGLKLEHFPYRAKDGLTGNNIGYVDAVVGFRGVYYPTDPIVNDRRIFDYAAELPGGIFNDDDAYFGICLSRLGVPVYAVKPPRAAGRTVRLISTQGCGESAVQEQAPVHRIENEMEIYQFAVAKGWLPSQAAKDHPEPAFRRWLKRSRFGCKLLRWHFNL